jgi:predicted ester cyclase
MTTAEDNKAIVREFVDALFTRGDLGAVDRILSDDFINHDPPFGAPAGPEGMRAAAMIFRSACTDWHSDYPFLVSEGNLVVEPFTASGTHTGELMGIVGKGQQLTLAGINIFRVGNGQIVERWGRLDELGLLRQLGLVPQP